MSSRLTVVAAFAFGLSLSSCGGDSVGLPPVLAASAHFRYHVEPPQLASSGIRSALESNRADVLAYLGLPDDDQVIDYYLLFATSVSEHCSTQESCARGRQVFTTSRLDRHELMHAFSRARAIRRTRSRRGLPKPSAATKSLLPTIELRNVARALSHARRWRKVRLLRGVHASGAPALTAIWPAAVPRLLPNGEVNDRCGGLRFRVPAVLVGQRR